MTAAFPICFGEAWKALFIAFRAPGRCMRMRSESNSALKLLILDSGALDKAVYSSIEIRTALGASCFVITTTPPCMAFSSRCPKEFFASVAGTNAGRLSVVRMVLFHQMSIIANIAIKANIGDYREVERSET